MAKKAHGKGIFITFEGPEGSGKTTHSRALVDWLRSSGREVIATREPGGTPFGDTLREILLSHKGYESIDSVTELLLYEAIRAHHVENIIRPALERGAIVMCDRFTDATVAYQGFGRRIPLGLVSSLNSIAARGVRPDLTIILDVSPETGLRIAKRENRAESPAGTLDRIEAAGIAFHRRVRAGYKSIAKGNKRRYVVVRRKHAVEETFSVITRAVRARFPRLLLS